MRYGIRENACNLFFVLAVVKSPYAKALLFPGKSALMLSTGVTL